MNGLSLMYHPFINYFYTVLLIFIPINSFILLLILKICKRGDKKAIEIVFESGAKPIEDVADHAAGWGLEILQFLHSKGYLFNLLIVSLYFIAIICCMLF